MLSILSDVGVIDIYIDIGNVFRMVAAMVFRWEDRVRSVHSVVTCCAWDFFKMLIVIVINSDVAFGLFILF